MRVDDRKCDLCGLFVPIIWEAMNVWAVCRVFMWLLQICVYNHSQSIGRYGVHCGTQNFSCTKMEFQWLQKYETLYCGRQIELISYTDLFICIFLKNGDFFKVNFTFNFMLSALIIFLLIGFRLATQFCLFFVYCSWCFQGTDSNTHSEESYYVNTFIMRITVLVIS